MDFSNINFDAVEVAPSFEPLPAGNYKCVITDHEQKPTKAQTGSYLQLKIEVIEGHYTGRVVFDRLNLENPNATAVEIATRTLKSIGAALQVPLHNSEELLDKPLMVKLAVRPASNGYEASNDVKGYSSAGANAGYTQAAPAAAPQAAAAPPWKR
jgi:hypothetical protein